MNGEIFTFGDDASWVVLLAALAAVVVAFIVHRVGAVLLRRVTRGTPVARAVADSCWRPASVVLPLLALQSVWQAAPD
ncbi:MAG: mechanosensitive ion channel family protein, partial [Polaromonas sp.]|nr:mechanosensitive ion channel family protein [Polaromonas sp.]